MSKNKLSKEDAENLKKLLDCCLEGMTLVTENVKKDIDKQTVKPKNKKKRSKS